ncbi:MAG: PIN domain-containing protein [Pseudonocardiaceae bacterium]|nr:PIN domain-containing protein [Pseudonocardiaceae bacterium]
MIDTSAWIEYLRHTGSPANVEVKRLLQEEPGDAVVTEPIVMELLAGPTDPHVVAKLERLVDGLPLLPVDAELDYRAAATVYRTARQSGRTVRSLVDCVIAVVAARAGAVLLHADRDFGVLAECLPDLRVHPS